MGYPSESLPNVFLQFTIIPNHGWKIKELVQQGALDWFLKNHEDPLC